MDDVRTYCLEISCVGMPPVPIAVRLVDAVRRRSVEREPTPISQALPSAARIATTPPLNPSSGDTQTAIGSGSPRSAGRAHSIDWCYSEVMWCFGVMWCYREGSCARANRHQMCGTRRTLSPEETRATRHAAHITATALVIIPRLRRSTGRRSKGLTHRWTRSPPQRPGVRASLVDRHVLSMPWTRCHSTGPVSGLNSIDNTRRMILARRVRARRPDNPTDRERSARGHPRSMRVTVPRFRGPSYRR